MSSRWLRNAGGGGGKKTERKNERKNKDRQKPAEELKKGTRKEHLPIQKGKSTEFGM